MGIKLSPDQKDALMQMIEWCKKESSPYLTLGGYAGTGKTTLLAQFRKILHRARPKTRVAFCAYTGKASQVLQSTLSNYQIKLPQDSVGTIHSLMYAPLVDGKGGVTGWKKKSEIKADLILIDEASMVDQFLWSDLSSFGIPILAVGDHGQLPPVNGKFNLMNKPKIRLEKIHRQAAENPIIKLSQMAREGKVIPIKSYGSLVRKLNRYDSYSGQEVEELLRSHGDDLLVLCGYNFTRIRLNQAVRQYQDRDSDRPVVGERLICLKNNWKKGIYNGMMTTVRSIKDKTDRSGTVHWYSVDLDLDDGNNYSGKISAHQFDQPQTLQKYEHLTYKTLGDLFDYGYALTVHKAQGSQAPKVLLFEERNKHMSDEDWNRWLYTGITRSEEQLVIVGTE